MHKGSGLNNLQDNSCTVSTGFKC